VYRSYVSYAPTAEGSVPIEDVEVGDFVLSRDPETGRQEYRKVLQRFVTPEKSLLVIGVRNSQAAESKIEVTGEHPFWVVDRGWVFARELRLGDMLSTTYDVVEVVSSAEGSVATVYNFEVEGFHTYFAGAEGAWVHNNPCAKATRGGQKLLGPIIQPRTLAEAVGNQGQALVNQVLKGRGALGNLTTAERTEAAKFFRDVATRTNGANAEAAAQFNRLRADFLEGKTSEVPGYINDFIQRHGL